MSEILIASHVSKTWTAERFSLSRQITNPWIEPAVQTVSQYTPAGIKDVSFSVEAGEIFGFVGPSGSGKSTLLRLVSGQVPPEEGWINVSGFDLAAPERQRALSQISLISQVTSGQVYNRLSAVENLIYSARLYGQNTSVLGAVDLGSQARTILSQLGLSWSEMDRPLKETHDTTLIKVAVARALICRPRLLLLDEVTKGFDLDARRIFLQVLETHRQQDQITIIIATRSLRTAEQACDRIAFLSQGKITHEITKNVVLYSSDHIHELPEQMMDSSYQTAPACEYQAV